MQVQFQICNNIKEGTRLAPHYREKIEMYLAIRSAIMMNQDYLVTFLWSKIGPMRPPLHKISA